jgi:hypothetical protein
MENKVFSYDAVDSMRDSVDLAEEIASCDRLIEADNVPEDIKNEMREKKALLLKLKEGNDSFVLNEIKRDKK